MSNIPRERWMIIIETVIRYIIIALDYTCSVTGVSSVPSWIVDGNGCTLHERRTRGKRLVYSRDAARVSLYFAEIRWEKCNESSHLKFTLLHKWMQQFFSHNFRSLIVFDFFHIYIIKYNINFNLELDLKIFKEDGLLSSYVYFLLIEKSKYDRIIYLKIFNIKNTKNTRDTKNTKKIILIWILYDIIKYNYFNWYNQHTKKSWAKDIDQGEKIHSIANTSLLLSFFIEWATRSAFLWQDELRKERIDRQLASTCFAT